MNKDKFNNHLFIKIISLALLFSSWELLSTFSNKMTFPSLISVGETLLYEISKGELLFHLSITLYRVMVSVLIAIIIGQ